MRKHLKGILGLLFGATFLLGAGVACKDDDESSRYYPDDSFYSEDVSSEKDDSIGTEIQLNEAVTDNLSESGEKDWFKFTIPSDGYITIDFEHSVLASTKNHWCLDFFMEDATTGYAREKGRTYWDIVGNENFTTPQMGVKPGTYYLEVQRSYSAWDATDYNITVNYTESTDWETELNNKYNNANDISIGAEKKGTLAVGEDHDWYKFEIESDGYISIDFTHDVVASTKNHWCMDLFMSDATTGYAQNKGRAYWDIIGNEDCSTENMGVKAGVYYLQIQRAYSAWEPVEYSITVNHTEATDWETELNNKYEKANDISVNVEKKGSLAVSDDHDWYKFEIESDGYISIDFTHDVVASTKNHWCMDLFMSDATTGYGQNKGRAYWDIVGNEDLSTLNMGVKKGVYYLQIQRAYSAWEPVEYGITINYTEATNWETEINNKYEKSNDISVGQTQYGTLVHGDDHDWYKVTIPGSGYITIDFNHEIVESTSNHWCLDLYQSDATTGYGKEKGRTYWDIIGNKNLTTEKLGVTEGTYYIEIQRAYSAWSGVDYGITVNFVEEKWEREDNNSKDKATHLYADSACGGSTKNSDDADWFIYSAGSAYGSINLTFTHESLDTNSTCWKITMYSADGTTEIGSIDIKGNQSITTYTFYGSGTVYIKVTKGSYNLWQGGYNMSSTEYSLQVG